MLALKSRRLKVKGKYPFLKNILKYDREFHKEISNKGSPSVTLVIKLLTTDM